MRGEFLRQAFEAFRQLLPSAQISFEHAVSLTTALARGDLLRLAGLLRLRCSGGDRGGCLCAAYRLNIEGCGLRGQRYPPACLRIRCS
jgi:hypothetical protein